MAIPETLASLTRRMKAGGEDAFREFHAAWFHRLFRYGIVLMRGDEHAARDVTQETLLRVVRNIRVFEEESAFWSWLACLARSAAADHGRKRSRYRSLLEKFIGEARAPEVSAGSAPDLAALLHRGLDRLDDDTRDLLREKYLHGLSIRQLAENLSTSEAAIESRLARGRRELRGIVFKLTTAEDET